MSKLLPKSTRSRALAAGGILLVAVVVLGAVKALGGADGAPLPDGEKQPEAVSFSNEPMWGAHDLGMRKVAGIELRGDTAVVAGHVQSQSRLAVVDARTGKPRWVVDSDTFLRGGDGIRAAKTLQGVQGEPLVYGDGDDWTVLVQYRKGPRNEETEFGVAALSGKDGAVRWTHALVRPESGDDLDMRLLAAGPRAVLTSVEAERGEDPKTVALDPATGEKLWEYEGGWAYRLAGDLVLGETGGDEAPSGGWGEPREGTDVFALDVQSGRKRWGLGDAHLSAVAGGTAVVEVTAAGRDRRTVLVDTATGRAGAEVDVSECADDGRTLIACAGARGRLVTVRDGGEPFTAQEPPFDEATPARVAMVRDDRIFLARPSGATAVVDRAANPLGAPPPGAAAAVSPHAIAFRVDDGLAVHAAAVGSQPNEPDGPGEPALQPPPVEAAPLWTAGTAGTAEAPDSPAADTGLKALTGIELAGDAVVYAGRERDGEHVRKQVVADAATGEERWSIREGGPLGGGAKAGGVVEPRIVSVDGELLSLVRYETSGDESGIAALSIRDGGVRWKKPVEDGDGRVFLEAADDEAFAVRVTSPSDDDDLVAVYETGTREELWRERVGRPVSVGGGLVIAAELAPADRGGVTPHELTAYGTADGERRWRLGDRYREPRLLHHEGGRTVVVGTAEGGVVLDAATGRELARTPQLLECDGDGDAMIVCEAGESPARRAVTVQTRDGATEVHDLLATAPLSPYGAAGKWFTAVRSAEAESGEKTERFLLLDGAGRTVSDDLPGRLRSIGGGFAVLTPPDTTLQATGAGVPGFTVHRVRG